MKKRKRVAVGKNAYRRPRVFLSNESWKRYENKDHYR